MSRDRLDQSSSLPLAQRHGEINVPEAGLVTDLRRAAQASGVLPNDPLAVLVDAMAQVVVSLDRQQATLDVNAASMMRQLVNVLREGRDTARAEVEKVHAQAKAREVNLTRHIAEASAKASADALTRCARALDRRAAAMVGVCLVGSLGLGTAAGWWIGDRNARAAVVETEADLRAAFQEGSEAAKIWVQLMQWNDPRVALLTCRESAEIWMLDGRRACRVPLWVQKPPSVRP